MTKAILYTRFSPRRDAELCQSIEVQLDVCGDYCAARGYEIAGQYEDREWSGGEHNRPGLWNAIAALRRGWVLVASKPDRLARSVLLSEIVYRDVARKRARVEVVDGARNGESPEDVCMRQVMAAFAEMERKVTAARTRAAQRRYQAEGIAMSDRPPYGMRRGPDRLVRGRGGERVQRTLVPDEAEQATIARMLGMRAAGYSFRRIGRELAKLGIHPRSAQTWDHKLIGRICQSNKELTQ